MIQKIQNSERFKKEYKQFQDRISKVTNESLQKKLTEMLLNLKEQIMFLDRQHEQVYVSFRIPTDVQETRSSISQIRKSLEDKLTTWESGQSV
jgi:hypothetical protein